LEINFLVRNKALDEETIRKIITSINVDPSPGSAVDHFRKGLELFNQSHYQEAQFSFAYALSQDWQNPQYHYHLGRTSWEVRNLPSAKYHLQTALSIRKDFPEAQKLFDQVKAEEQNKPAP